MMICNKIIKNLSELFVNLTGAQQGFNNMIKYIKMFNSNKNPDHYFVNYLTINEVNRGPDLLNYDEIKMFKTYIPSEDTKDSLNNDCKTCYENKRGECWNYPLLASGKINQDRDDDRWRNEGDRFLKHSSQFNCPGHSDYLKSQVELAPYKLESIKAYHGNDVDEDEEHFDKIQEFISTYEPFNKINGGDYISISIDKHDNVKARYYTSSEPIILYDIPLSNTLSEIYKRKIITKDILEKLSYNKLLEPFIYIKERYRSKLTQKLLELGLTQDMIYGLIHTFKMTHKPLIPNFSETAEALADASQKHSK